MGQGFWIDLNPTPENQKCKNCSYLKKLHKQEETEADTFICMKNIVVMPTEVHGSYSCSNFEWKTED